MKFALAALVASAAAQCTVKPEALVFGHRGNSWGLPESTLQAFQSTLDLGAGANELDCYITSDKQLVVIHDSTVDRTTNGTGKVSDYTLQELQALDAGYKFTRDGGASYPYRGQGFYIPTMREVFETIGSGLINIDLKDSDSDLAARLLVEAISDSRVDKSRIVAGGFEARATNAVRRLDPDLMTMAPVTEATAYVLAFYANNTESYNRKADRHQLPTGLAEPREFIADLNALGGRMDFWTINDVDTMTELFCAGADGVITDKVEEAVQVLKDLQSKYL